MEAMDLFERYLQAVRKYLPSKGQDDIVAELRANLDAQREEREAGLGRPLSEGEMIDWLKELGPPMQMAARYQPPRYLIGPTVFPFFWYVLRIVLILSSVVYVIAHVALAIAQPHDSSWVFQVVFGWPAFLIVPAAWVTVAFIVLEFFYERYPEKCQAMFSGWPGMTWTPTSLPPLEKLPAGSKPRSLTAAIAEFAVEFALLLWLLLIPHFPFLLLGPGVVVLKSVPVSLAPVMVHFYWAIFTFGALQFAWHGYNLLSDRWRIRRPVEHLVVKGLAFVPLIILLAAPGHLYLLPNPAATGHLPNGINLAGANQGIFSVVTLLLVITAFQFAWDLWKAISTARRQRPPVVV